MYNKQQQPQQGGGGGGSAPGPGASGNRVSVQNSNTNQNQNQGPPRHPRNFRHHGNHQAQYQTGPGQGMGHLFTSVRTTPYEHIFV